ncbi:uncharacterized protein B0H64DRAFT_3001 [Chaetomium fimeti]|uniref:PhoD-like phosphatase domain-containing protein n=1 Tax=Chaetomium fimeti TaxID=1854472 RepID=A0AAE0HNZ4_9PEZI|nr:hypothetical protein B0H64DRAFT_3001 [Chaetomium fimeti]
MSAPYWGQLPPPQAGQTRARRLSEEQDPLTDRRQSLDAPVQGQPRSNRISVQTTKSDAPTDSTFSPFVSPTASSFQGQGLTPRPPSLPYAADQYPPELLENRRRRKSRNQEQEADYAAVTDALPPAAPDVPRAPPSSSKYPPASGGPLYQNQPSPQGIGRQGSQRETEEHRRREKYPVSDRTRNMLEESAMPRPQRVTTDPTLGRMSPLPNGRRRSAAEQSLQRSARRTSTSTATDRPKAFADVRSPLQRLELTLDSISKEDKRARVEAAERAARERAAAKEGIAQDERSPQQVRFHERPTPGAAGDSPAIPITPTRPAQHSAGQNAQNGPLSQNPPDEGRRHSTSGGPSPRGPNPESRIPAPIQSSGIPQRNLSFRERAARTDGKIPNSLDSPASKETTTPTAGPDGRTPPRSGSNRLRKNPPGDMWPNRISETDEIYNTGEVVAHTPRVVGGPGMPTNTRATNPPERRQFEPAAKAPPTRDPNLLDDDFAEEFMLYPSTGKLTKSPSQRKANQILGRGPTQTAATDGDQNAVSFRAMTSPAAAMNPPAYPPGGETREPHFGPPGEHETHTDASGQRHHVSDYLYNARDKFQPGQGIFQPSKFLEEWKGANVGALSGGLLDLEDVPASGEKNAALVDASQSRLRSNSLSSRPKKAEAFEGEYDETNNGTRTPNQQAVYPSIREVQSGDFHLQSTSSFGAGSLFEPQHLASRRARARAKRWDGLRPFSPSPSANDSQDSLGCFSLSSNDAAFSRLALPYSSPTRFKPPLYLKCGPLLRYCGIRHERVPNRPSRTGAAVEREIWRGSIMIVTTDSDSSYDIAPILRLFAQPIELLPPPPREVQGDLAPEYIDPIAGHPKLGRKGETLYVRPVDHLEEGKDVSRNETDEGLYEKSRSPPEVPLPDGMIDPPGSFAARRKRAEMDGEKAGKYKDIRGFRLHTERGYTFWRFNVEVELRDKQQRIAYRINRGPSTGFWVPAKGQSMNIMFHSCNGFSLSADSNQFTGPDPMWRDVLNSHQSQPFHVMIGGGDQIYNDRCMQETTIFKDWLMTKNPLHKHNAPFTPEMQSELEEFYLERYAMWFSQGLFGMANSQIPMVNMYDDHDIIDGFGSYPHHFMNSPVFSGLGNVAFKYYMLFQHQSVMAETEKTEPSWILGTRPGPYITELSRSLFMFLGGKVALLVVDSRTERTREEVMREDTWKKIMDRCYGEIDKGKIEHLLVVMGVPIAYPRLVWLENILTSRVMDPVKALAKLGMFGGLLNRFDGGVEVLDDLDDHWTAKNHKQERALVIEDLQDLAADKSMRVSILSGDVHLAAIGQFYSNPKLGLAKHKDFRYIPNIISSAIVNTPPPDLLADVLNKRNKVHHFDKETDEDMIPIFGHGVDGKPRNNKHLLPHRNWCAIRQYVPGHTPPPTPGGSAYDITSQSGEVRKRRSSIFRRLSISRSKTTGPDGGPKDRSRPPVSGGLLKSLSRRAVAASADDLGKPGPPKPGFLTRTMSSSSVSSRIGGLFRRGSSASRRDDGGINGTWGADTDEEEAQYQQQQQFDHPRGGVGMRGGLGGEYAHTTQTSGGGGGYNSEYDQGDEGFFTVKPAPPAPSSGGYSDDYRPPVPPKPVMTGGAGVGPQQPQQQGQGQQQGAGAAGVGEEAGFVPKPFHRAPTTLSVKQRKTFRPEDYAVDLTGAMEVTLNVEISPKDPGGSTVPYRLVVPRLWYEYEGEGEEDGEGEGESEEGEGVSGAGAGAGAGAQQRGVGNMGLAPPGDRPGVGFEKGVGVGERGGEVEGGIGGGVVGVGEPKKAGIKRLLSLRKSG